MLLRFSSVIISLLSTVSYLLYAHKRRQCEGILNTMPNHPVYLHMLKSHRHKRTIVYETTTKHSVQQRLDWET